MGSRRPFAESGDDLQRVALVSDGSALPSGADVLSSLRQEAAQLRRLIGAPTFPVVILAETADGLAAGVRALPADVGTVLLTQVEPERAYQVTHDLRAGDVRPTISDHEATAIVLTAIALRSMAFDGRRPHRSTTVVAGARALPVLPAVLMAAGIGDITTWNRSDAEAFPLHNVLYGADTLIDLVGEPADAMTYRRAGITAITRDDAFIAPFVTAGLLRAALDTPELSFDIEIYAACAQALAPSFPNVRTIPQEQGTALTQLISNTAAGVHQTRLAR